MGVGLVRRHTLGVDVSTWLASTSVSIYAASTSSTANHSLNTNQAADKGHRFIPSIAFPYCFF